jgi:inner membrane protein
MDSITQAALGAAVAEAGMGRRLGNKAIVWGAVLGTLPDLDIIAYPWLDHLQRLEWHRGASHSLPIMLLAAPLIGWMISKIHAGKISTVAAAWTVFWILATHTLIDVFTVYGTMVFAPFSNHRAGFNNLFIIDPLFTAPLLLGLLIAIFYTPTARLRRIANNAGIVFASLYVLWSYTAKEMAGSAFEKALTDSGIAAERSMTAPTAFNTLLWRCLAETDDGYHVAYHSLLRPGKQITFDFIPKNKAALAEIRDTPALERLLWFSNGYLTVQPDGSGWLASDWRFGERRHASGPLSSENAPAAVFSWRIRPEGDALAISPERPRWNYGEYLRQIWERLYY